MLYTINLIWINKKKHDSTLFVFPSNFLDNVKKWADWNTSADVIVWFHSALCTAAQIERTNKELASHENLYLQDLDGIASDAFLYAKSKAISKSASSNLKARFRDPIVPVYWKADLSRCLVLTKVATRYPDRYHCYSDLDLEPYNIECAFRNSPQYVHRLKMCGALFCHSNKTSLGLENAFMILSGSAFSLIDAVRLVMLDLACMLMNYFYDLANGNEQLLDEYTRKYSLNEWGYTHLSQLFNFDVIIRESYYLRSERPQAISLKGTCLGVESDALSLESYMDLMSIHPVLILENPIFWHWPQQFSILDYVDYIALKRSEPLSASERDTRCFIATDCSNSTFNMTAAEADRVYDLAHRGIGHDRKVKRDVLAIKSDVKSKFTLKVNQQYIT